MSTQIVYTAEVFPNGTQALTTVSNMMSQPASLGGQGVVRDDDLLGFWGLRANADVPNIAGSIVQRQITLQMGPSSTATATVTVDSGGVITAIAVTGQGLDYIRPPVPVVTDTGKGAGALLGPCSLQLLSTTQIYAGTGYTAPTIKAVGGLAPGGVPATFAAVLGGGGAISSITCTNAATNGPYALPPTLVITDTTGSGAQFISRMGLFPTIAVLKGGTTFYTNPAITFTPYFKNLCPDSNPTVQGTAVKGFMLSKLSQAMYMPVFEIAPVVS